jgi:hypothetical protein
MLAPRASLCKIGNTALKAVEEYLATLKKYPNPPPPKITQFRSGG